MKIIKGVKISPGIAIGPIFHFHRDSFQISKIKIKKHQINSEIFRLELAISKSIDELTQIRELVTYHLDNEHASMIDAQIMAMKDEIVIQSVKDIVTKELKNVLWAYYEVMSGFEKIMADASSEYLQERDVDLLDVKKRIIHHLSSDKNYSAPEITKPSIVICERITPSDFLHMDKKMVLGLITKIGGVDSHTGILARTLKIPYLSNIIEFHQLIKADKAIIDSYEEKVVIDYNDDEEEYYKKSIQNETRIQIKKVSATKDGTEFKIFVNGSFLSEIESMNLHYYSGVGLFRSEFLCIERNAIPSEDEQYRVYKQIVEHLKGKSVIFRTFDFGRDKFITMLDMEMFHQDQVFEEWGGIQFCLENPTILKNQFKAILRANTTTSEVKIMIPMVSTLKEIRDSKKILNEAKAELKSEKKPFSDKINFGVMVETKEILNILDEIATEVDFFSIGTNDLALYLFGSKRDQYNAKNHYHPTMYSSILKVIEAGKKHNLPVSVCGEMSSDPYALIGLIAIGIRSISINSGSLEQINSIISTIEINKVEQYKNKILKSSSAFENYSILKGIYNSSKYLF